MMFILRWPVILILLGLAAASVFPALIGTIQTYNIPIDLSPIAGASDNLQQWALSTTLPERVLWYAAAVFFFIAAVRLIRRTQGFWIWLLGFACLGGRWALAQQQQQGGLAATVESVASPESFRPETLAEGGSAAQMTFLVALLVIGLLIFVIDAADRAFWDRHGA